MYQVASSAAAAAAGRTAARCAARRPRAVEAGARAAGARSASRAKTALDYAVGTNHAEFAAVLRNELGGKRSADL